jgi:hypothetical protein
LTIGLVFFVSREVGMTQKQCDIKRKMQVLDYAKACGNVAKTERGPLIGLLIVPSRMLLARAARRARRGALGASIATLRMTTPRYSSRRCRWATTSSA